MKLFRHFIDTNNIDKNDKDRLGSNSKKLKDKEAEQLLLLRNGSNEIGIPASEIKLAKILMDKPAPHCSA